MPVVAFEDAGAFEHTFRTYGVGSLIAPFDTEAFAQELKWLLQDVTQRDTLGRAGSTLIKREFSFRKYVYDLLAVAQIPVKRVSIIVPNYNYCRYLEARLQSLSNQTIAPYEIIVLDDVSTDNSREWLDENLERICPGAESFYNERNSGSAFGQWLAGVRRARGDYVWIAEADDIAEPEFLADVLAKFDEPNVVLSFCQSKQMDSGGKILCDHYLDYVQDVSPTKWTEAYVNNGADEIVSALSVKNTIPNVSAVVFKRDTLLKVLEAKIDELVKFRVAGDWVTYIEVLRNGDIAFSPRSLNLHRRHESSITLSSFNLSQLKEIMSVQQYIRDGFNPPDAIVDLAEAYSQKLFEQFDLANPIVPSIRQHPELSQLLSPICFLVLGMHRSGTSLLAGLLGLFGASLPKNLLPSNTANPRGYFEPIKIVKLNDELLTALGSSWADFRHLDRHIFDAVAGPMKKTFLAALKEEYGKSTMFMLKDPRICRLIPFWRELLKSFGARVRPIITVRNPADVAYSLRRRDGLSIGYSLNLWLRYVLDAEFETRHSKRMFVKYDDLIDDWAKVVNKIQAEMGVAFLPGTPEMRAEADGLVDPDLRHFALDDKSLVLECRDNPLVLRTYRALERLTERSDDANAMTTLDDVRETFEAATMIFGSSFDFDQVVEPVGSYWAQSRGD